MNFLETISSVLFFYPLILSAFWIVGSILYYFFIESRTEKLDRSKERDGITFIVACFNEAATIEDTIKSVDQLSYPKKELIIVNDGSTDNSANVLKGLQSKYTFTFIDLKENRGKANALNVAAKNAQYDYFLVVDADTMIDDDAPYYMMDSFETYPGIGAVTGNPRIRNKSSLIGKIQTVEYASIIGGIKRAQAMNGYINTVSGVFTLFSKKAVEEAGYWDIDMVTEDIALTWKMHFKNFKIAYEPRALCWMIVPETINGLFKQRLRWAQGGQEVILRDYKKMFKQKSLQFWILFIEQITSVIWVFSIFILSIVLLLNINLIDYYFYGETLNIIVSSIFVLITINTVLFGIQLLIDSKYEKKNIFYLLFLSWYPIIYWVVNAVTTVFALPKAIRRKKGEYATWISPDRGDIQH